MGSRFVQIAWVFAAVALAPVAVVRATPPTIEGLLSNSPFGTVASSTAGARANQPLEYRGIMVENGAPYFSIFEVSTHSSAWVGLNESGNPFTVKSYDDTKDQVTVDYHGQTIIVPMKVAKVVALAMPPPVQVGAGGPGPVPMPGPVVGQSPNGGGNTPAEEAARLSAVAEEIRRRRALRAQLPQPAPQVNPANMPVPANVQRR